MKLNSVLGQKKLTLSFEVFPPKADSDYESVKQAAYRVAKLHPDYMSVTYGAGGSTGGSTIALAEGIQKEHGVTTIAHLTCVGATKESIQNALGDMKNAGIENVLALRGDRPAWMKEEPFTDYHYASASEAHVIRRGIRMQKVKARISKISGKRWMRAANF